MTLRYFFASIARSRPCGQRFARDRKCRRTWWGKWRFDEKSRWLAYVSGVGKSEHKATAS